MVSDYRISLHRQESVQFQSAFTADVSEKDEINRFVVMCYE